MIVLHKKPETAKTDKPVICPKCERGILGHIHEKSEAVLSKRGRPPPDEQGEYLQVRCFICRSQWNMTIEK